MSGEIVSKTLKVEMLDQARSDSYSKAICPFTPFIPMHYLKSYAYSTIVGQARNVVNVRNIFGIVPRRLLERLSEADITKLIAVKNKKASAHTLLYTLLLDMFMGSGNQMMYTEINNSMRFLSPSAIGYRTISTVVSNNTKTMAEVFGTAKSERFKLRTCEGVIGMMSMSSLVDGSRETYHILPVILPQNLYYQRMHLLLYGSIDLEYVIFLVDEQLERKDFPIPSLRTFYQGRLKEAIKTTGSQVYLVPVSFIYENCFVQKFQLKSKLPKERRMEKDSLVAIFRKQVPDSVLDWGLLYEPEGVKEVRGQEPLVPSVEPTSLVSDRLSELQIPAGSDNAFQRIAGPASAVTRAHGEILDSMGIPASRMGAPTGTVEAMLHSLGQSLTNAERDPSRSPMTQLSEEQMSEEGVATASNTLDMPW